MNIGDFISNRRIPRYRLAMPAARKRHVQQPIRFPDRNGQWRGGRRDGAGRPRRGRFASERHQTRPRIRPSQPVLVTVRVAPAVGTLRRWRVYHAMRRALAVALARPDFRVVHLSIQRTHVHLIAEAAGQRALSSGMQGLLISAARRINRAVGRVSGKPRRGAVFPDRYHERVIDSPRQCRHALAYVLNNFRRHGEDRFGAARAWLVDPLSSAIRFAGWRELARRARRFAPPDGYTPLPTSEPRTWLLRVAWQRHGTIGVRDVPGPPA